MHAQVTVSGTVTNERGEALIAASVFLIDSPYAAASNEDGSYVIRDIEPGTYVLKSSYIGYKSYVDTLDVRSDIKIDIVLKGSKYALDDIEITANRLEVNSPFSFTQVDEESLDRKNLAQDIPVLLEHNPSMVITSDAGAGVGYTGMRVRGSDATRVNVTVNGVPINDSESHGVFWVNMPDFASSVNDIQIQRGVGPSTNGAAAFGATVAMNTNVISETPMIKIGGSYGSFDTRRLSVSATTGLINDKLNIEGRYSIIKSDGYVDRASSDLKSYYFSVAYIDEKSSLRFNTFSGSERTYQSWWGVPQARVEGDEEALLEHYYNNLGGIYQTAQDSINLFNSDRRYNYYTYENQVDDYGQDHYQLIWARSFSDVWQLNATMHYTKGQGFFEEYRVDDALVFYGLEAEDENGSDILSSDLVRRRWLDNDFYGLILNNNFQINDDQSLLLGLSGNRYSGDHFGRVIWAQDFTVANPERNYYESDALKSDYNVYAKYNVTLKDKLLLFADIQNRYISYETMGDDNGGALIDVDTSYNFVNPKVGLTYLLSENQSVYASLSRAQREPVRSDFIDALGTRVPKHESMWDLEAGWRYSNANKRLNVNVYYMDYRNQLVNTGAVNDVGAPVRTNVDKSYRLGVELDGGIVFNSKFQWSANLALSQNKIKAFNEIIIDYDSFTEVINAFENTDIAFSPNVVGASILSYTPIPTLKLDLLSKYVGQQYLDNTSNDAKSLDAFFVNDLVLSYSPIIRGVHNVEFKFLVNNILGEAYSSNGYTYSYIFFQSLIEENFLYPQAGRNFLLGAEFSF